MTANLLTVNTSKTEFLLIGLKQQLAKIQNCTLTLLVTYILSLTNISLSLITYLHCPNPAILTFVNFALSAPILTSKQPIPSPPPLSTLNLTTVTLYYNLPYSQLNSLQQIQNYLTRAVLKPPSSLTLLLFLNLYTGSKSIRVLSIKFFLLHTTYLLLLKLATSEI